MRHYEIMIILDPNLEGVRSAVARGVPQVVTDDGSKVSKLDIWGKRRLSTRSTRAGGIYAVVDLNAEPASVRARSPAQPQRGRARTKVLRPGTADRPH
jgi:small subunit ribosomal protein S6